MPTTVIAWDAEWQEYTVRRGRSVFHTDDYADAVGTAAAMALVERMEWTGYGYWIGGSLPDETGYAFTCAPRVGGAR